MTEIKPVTYILCSDCGRRIPYLEERIERRRWKDGRVVVIEDLCMECASK